MKILLDENLPRKLVETLRAEGCIAESVMTLRMKGLDNGRLFRFACGEFDLFFTRDFGFAHNVRQQPAPNRLKLVHVTLPQQAQDKYVAAFMAHFRNPDWMALLHGADWP